MGANPQDNALPEGCLCHLGVPSYSLPQPRECDRAIGFRPRGVETDALA